MRMFLGVIGAAAAAAGLLLVAPVPSLAGDYRYDGYGHDGGWAGYRQEDGNSSYDAYNSYDGYARYSHGRRGYWERPYDHRYRSCRPTRYRSCYRGYRYDGYDGSGGGSWYYPGYGYGDTPSPAFPADGYRGHGGSRADWCAWRYRSYNPRTGYYVGYDGYRHYCG